MMLIMAGTADGRELVLKAALQGHQIIVTTATEYGAQLLTGYGQQQAQAERLDVDGLTTFIRKHYINTLIDATHPYAEAASRTAISACQITGCRYMRYERQVTYLDNFTGELIRVAEYSQAASRAAELTGNILLTTGSKTLSTFIDVLGVERLVARVLPTPSVLQHCTELGLKPSQIIAMQGPFSEALNIALIEQFDINLLMTKDSGEAGGMQEKLSAAAHCGIPVMLIDRPSIEYPNCYRDIDRLLAAL